MKTYTFLVLLSIALLVLMQSSQAAPNAKKAKDDSSSSEESDEANVKSDTKQDKKTDSSAESSEEVSNTQISTITSMDQMAAVSLAALKNLHNGFNNVLADETVKKLQTDKMKAYKEKIQNFLQKFEQYEKKEKPKELTFFNVLENAHDLLKSINTTNVENPSAEQVLLEVAFDKHVVKKQNAAVPVDVLQVMGDLSKYNTDEQMQTDAKAANEINWREEMKHSGDSAKNPTTIAKFMELFTTFG